jgi:phenylalanine-4-hydroxylase
MNLPSNNPFPQGHSPSSPTPSCPQSNPSEKWFPKCLSDLNQVPKSIFEPGKDLISDHPGFSDPSYIKRRRQISEIAENFSILSEEIPIVDYTKSEKATWSAIYDILTNLHKTHACEEYLVNFEKLSKNYGLSRDRIPQLQEVSEYLQSTSGFRVIPISGMLTQRDFLSFLAFKVFTSTQFIRHGSDPLYSPEPDLVHEILGHIPMLATPEFAEFSQIIGLASLGASDEDIEKLGKCYLFSVEFGLIRREDFKIYGAGILSSAKEMINTVQGKPKFHFFQPEETCKFHCPLSDLQTDLFWSHSLTEAKEKMIQFVRKFEKGFETRFDPVKKEVLVKSL